MSGHGSERSNKRHISLLRQTKVQLEIFKCFVETSGQALGMADLDGRVFFVNSILCRMLGREKPEAVYEEDLYAFYSLETAQRLREEILPQVRRYGQWVGELSLIDAQGRATPTIENIFLLRDDKAKPLCFAAVFTDISERIRQEQELKTYRDQLEHLVAERTSELEKRNVQLREEIVERKRAEKEHTRLMKILDSTSDLVGAALPNGQGLYMNTAGRRMAGFGVDENLSKRNMSEVHPAWAWPYVEKTGIPTAIKQGVWEGETVIVNHTNGTEIPVSQVIMAHRTASGDIDFISTIIRDISERKRMEESLRESEEKYRTIVDNMQDAFFRCDLNGEIIYTTASAARLLGCPSAEEMVGLRVKDFYYHPEEAEKHFEMLQSQGRLAHYELTLKRQDNGQPVVVLANSQFYRDKDGTIIGIEGVYSDITDRKQAEEALRKSEEKYRRIIDTANEGIWLLDADLLTTFVNARLAEIIGYPMEEIIGRKFEAFLFNEDLEEHEKKIEARKQGLSGRYERRLRHKDGHAVLTFISATPIFDNEHHFQGSFAMITDITERKQTEVELLKLASVITHCSELVNLATPDWKMIYLNEAGMRMLGISADELEGIDIRQVIPDHLLEKVQKEVLPAMTAGGWEGELEYKNLKTGALTAVYATIFLVKDPETGVPLYHANVSLDISARKEAEQSLKKSLDILAEAERIGHTGSWQWDLATNDVILSSGTRRILGISDTEEIPFEKFMSRHHPEDLDVVMKELMDTRERGTPHTIEHRIVLPDGSIRSILGRAEALCDPQGKPVLLHGTIQDITERRVLEDELIKAQKLDSIGTLAGGLAHDYNNLLTAIMGNMDLAKMHIDKDNQALALLAKAQKAAMTARDLTQQLITFSQGGYPQVKVMPIQDLLRESVGLGLRGSNTRTVWKIADDLPEVKIDANQIRQAIHNIVINAQEAMPEGGSLFIEANMTILGPDNPLSLAKGIYARLVFRDEGRGITAENLPKVFDPYFTTKDMGSTKGMGLGLSICYSVIKRHGGHIIVDSTFGIGTTVTVYIPKGHA